VARTILITLAFLAGLGYIIVTPPDRAPDELNHFLRAVAIAEGDFVPKVGYISPGHYFPGGIWMFRDHVLKRDFRAARADTLNRQQRVGIEFPAWYSPMPYIAQSAIAFAGLHLDWRPYWIFYLGRVANLIACLVIVFTAMRTLPHRAAVAGAVLLLPMTLSQMAAWSADGMTIAVAILTTCLVVRALEGRDDVRALAATAFLLSLCKPAYFLLVVPVLFVRRRIAATLLIAAAVVIGTLLAAAAARAGQYNPRAHLPVDPAQQLRCVLDDPLRFANVFANDLRANGVFYLDETIGRLGIMDVKLPMPLIVAEWLLLSLVGFSCGVRWTLPSRLIAIAVCAATIVGIALAQYLVWSIICGETIDGIQGRYFLPLLPLLLFLLAAKPREHAMPLWPIATMGVMANAIAIAVLQVHPH
jgi:uncharacterized membrane protein